MPSVYPVVGLISSGRRRIGFGAVAIVLLAAALVACVVPARRAASVDPLTALRQE